MVVKQDMWRPHSLNSEAVGTATLRSLVVVWHKVRSRDPVAVRQVVTFFAGLVAFISATEYFSAKPSIRITVTRFPHVIVNPGLVQQFYREAGTSIPELLLRNSSIACLFDKSFAQGNAFVDDAQLGFGPLKELTKGPPNVFIPELERLLKGDVWPKVLSGWSTRGGLMMETVDGQLSSLKAQLTSGDYRDLLEAIMYSRVFENVIDVENDGDLDLRSVLIVVPSPLVRSTDSREDNILFVQSNNIHLCDIARYKNRTEIRIPVLDRHQGILFVVHTRESRIPGREIVHSFDSGKPSSNLAFVFALATIVTIGVHVLCKGRPRGA